MRVRGEVGRSGMPTGQTKGSSHLGTDCLPPGGHAGPSYYDDAFLVAFGSVWVSFPKSLQEVGCSGRCHLSQKPSVTCLLVFAW